MPVVRDVLPASNAGAEVEMPPSLSEQGASAWRCQSLSMIVSGLSSAPSWSMKADSAIGSAATRFAPFGMSLIALNMVHAVRVSADRIEVDLVMNCPGCPAGEITLAQARQNLMALNSGDVRLNLLPQIWTPPWEQIA